MAKNDLPHLVKILGRLDKVRPSGEGWTAMCPAHKDTNPSLTVGVGNASRVLLNCHRGCEVRDILEAIDLKMPDLFAPDDKKDRVKNKFVEGYRYTDEEGRLLYEVARWEQPDGRKTFTQRKPDGNGGWVYSLGDVRRPLYRLPQIVEAVKNGETIYVVEGERDVHTLEKLGLTATTNSGGARGWRPEHSEQLVGANLVVVADRDEAGITRAFEIAKSLDNRAKSMKLLVPPDGFNDISDVAVKHPTVENLLAALEPLKEMVIVETAGTLLESPEEKFDPKKTYGFSVEARLIKWDKFLSEDANDEYDWIIPNVLERQERVMVVAPEGVGKSMLARQVQILSSAGLHPFKPTNRMTPIKTLMVDLENPERIIRRTSRKIVEKARFALNGNLGDFPAHLVPKPDGLDLLADKDREIFEGFVAAAEPDLLFVGPLYKAFIDPGARTAEAVATELARFFDYIRVTYNCALWIEHHAPLGGESRYLRPFGSAVWSRWSEFGLAIYPDPTNPFHYEIRHYRGMRDVRAWPKYMKRGSIFPFEVLEFYDM